MIVSHRVRSAASLAAFSMLTCVPALAAADDEGVASAELTMEPTKLDPAGSREAGTMYFPSGAKLTDEKPGMVKKEPAYRAKARYATITLGNGKPSEFAIAFDEPEGKDAKVYPDLNGDGDLTNDGDGEWPTKDKAVEGQAQSYSGTFVFDTSWTNAGAKPSKGKYGINFYRSPDREQVNYYRAAARTGKIDVNGKSYQVVMWENDNDGLYNKLYDPKVGGEVKTKAVALTLDGDQFDIRGTFSFGDSNYMALVPDDGSKLTLKPTAKAIRLPRAGMKVMGNDTRPELLKAGTAAPEFSVIAWRPELPAGQEPPAMKLSDFKGKKVVVVDFWATWCGPCMKGLPHVNKVAEAVKGQDVVVLALNTWDDQAAYERFARTKGKDMSLSLVRDPAGKQDGNKASIASRLYNVSGIPATYVIDKDGKIAASISGYSEGDRELEDALKKLGVKID